MAKARYVSTVLVDNGALQIDPAGGATPGISISRADAMFRAADAVEGDRGFAIFGLGVATVSKSVPVASSAGLTTTTTPPAPPGATTTGPTTTTTPSTTTTTGATETQPGVPTYDHRLAWVGIVWDADQACGSTSTTRPPPPHTSKYVAVLLDAHTGRDALAYSSATETCGGSRRAPTVSRPTELQSVPWQPVASASTAVHATLPACSEYAGWTQVSQPGSASTAVEVVARVPYDPACGSTSAHDVIVDDVVPLGADQQAQLTHASIGPVDALHALPTSGR